jgi:hypothetical protein
MEVSLSSGVRAKFSGSRPYQWVNLLPEVGITQVDGGRGKTYCFITSWA